VGVENDTTMRDQRKPEPTSIKDSPILGPVSRRFAPAALDIDDLAEAIRMLLDDLPSTTRISAETDLPFPARRATHVMEARETT
jgi:hypothetical protein